MLYSGTIGFSHHQRGGPSGDSAHAPSASWRRKSQLSLCLRAFRLLSASALLSTWSAFSPCIGVGVWISRGSESVSALCDSAGGLSPGVVSPQPP
ncbi:hypothetical protein HPB50_010842 [Hyalomma asiaticum]|uniref:Uncharacterized protein n=1 Tax=Hyalomma asiaticum TaxID=266040 RepID=A0ACB7RRH8_HYAAI|nr:hypothetical protein HPB50_010842 [Hyalomma asiaticum]